jgi:hypothetical protein
MSECSNNTFCHNNFLENTKNVYLYVPGYSNFWDNGTEGNYWSDYQGTDANQDGVGDTSYVIDANNIDHYPLMIRHSIPEFSPFLILPLFMIATLLAVAAYKRRITHTSFRCRYFTQVLRDPADFHFSDIDFLVLSLCCLLNLLFSLCSEEFGNHILDRHGEASSSVYVAQL